MASRISTLKNHLVPSGREDLVWNKINTKPDATGVPPLKVCVSGAAGQIAYSLIFQVASGRLLGPHQPVVLCLFDIPAAMAGLQGVLLEIEDCAFPLVQKTIITSDVVEAFKDAHVVLLLGAFPRGPGMERKDLLQKNVNIFRDQGAVLDKYAQRDVKVVVVGNPANTNCWALKAAAPSLPASSFSALTRLDQNRAMSQIALKAKTGVSNVKNVIIWGNHSNTQYPDVSHATLVDYPNPGMTVPVQSVVSDREWLQDVFIPKVQQRGAEVIKVRKASSAASAANAIVDHVRSWVLGTEEGTMVSMAVASDGSYGVPQGLMFSFPVICRNGDFKIVQGLQLDAFSNKLMAKTTTELIEERDMAQSFMGSK